MQRLFKDAGFEVVKARVLNENGKSRGVGFVEFPNEETQKRAMEKMKGKEVDGRTIVIKLALQSTQQSTPSQQQQQKAGKMEKKK